MGAAVFLDRDGTLIDEPGYLADPDALRLLPGAADAVAAWNRAGLLVVLVTNQSGVARGLLDEAGLARVHARLEERLADAGTPGLPAVVAGRQKGPRRPLSGR